MEKQEQEDHYEILGLPSGREGAKVSGSEIRKAYRARALECHPDKRPDDPNAAALFQKIQHAYELLTDAAARKAFDDFLQLRDQRLRRQHQHQHHYEDHRPPEVSAKRRKMMDELREKEKAYEMQKEQEDKARADEERAAKRFQEEVARIRAKHAQKKSEFHFNMASARTPPKAKEAQTESGPALDKAKMLKVTWNSLDGRGDYSAERLREIFQKFGTVEDIVVRRKDSKKKASAVIVMGSKAEADAAIQNPNGDLSNPLLVLPLLPSAANSEFVFDYKEAEPENDRELKNVVGAGYHAHEDTILKKLQQAAEKARLKKQAPS
uniref:J domain-containing protein n=1 Tax=Araucaria cunninghamii TaxID=56994 RepID=A0A0D6QXP5_ARACU